MSNLHKSNHKQEYIGFSIINAVHSILQYPTVILSNILQYTVHAIVKMSAISLLHDLISNIGDVLKYCSTLIV